MYSFEVPNHQLCTVSRLYVTTFQLVVPKDRKQSYQNLEAHPHMGPHIWVSGYAPAFLPLIKHGYILFPTQEPTNLPGLLVPNGRKQPDSITWSKVNNEGSLTN